MDSTAGSHGRGVAFRTTGERGSNAAIVTPATDGSRLRTTYIWAAALAAACLMALFFAAGAHATLSSFAYTGDFTDEDTGGASTYTLSAEVHSPGESADGADGDDLKKLVMDWPTGLQGNPNAIPAASRCNGAGAGFDYNGGTAGVGVPEDVATSDAKPDYGWCAANAPGSLVGRIRADAIASVTFLFRVNCTVTMRGNIYLLRNRPTADPEMPVYVGIELSGTPSGFPCNVVGEQKQFLMAKIVVRPDDQALRVIVLNTMPRTQPTSLGNADLRIWKIAQTINARTTTGKAFMRNPTRCLPDTWKSVGYAQAYNKNTSGANVVDLDPEGTGSSDKYVMSSNVTTPRCDAPPAFNPSFTITNSDKHAGAPTGIRATLMNPVEANSSLDQPSYIKKVSMAMPKDVRINPAVADRLGANGCTEAQFNKAYPNATPTCPVGSEIGTAAATVPQISGDLIGKLYLGHPQTGDEAAGIFRLYLQAKRGGVAVKFEGRAVVNQNRLDPNYGQVSVEFGDPSYSPPASPGLPQFMYSKFILDFDSASLGVGLDNVGSPVSNPVWNPDPDRQMMMNPQVCGTYPMDTTFTPWTTPVQAPVVRQNSFTVTAGYNGSCNYDAFAPTFSVNLTKDYDPTVPPANPNSLQNAPAITGVGMHPTMTFSIHRNDRMDNLKNLRFVMPEGFGGSMKATQNVCTIATLDNIANGLPASCPADSKIGIVTVQTGAGPKPITIYGGIYLMERLPAEKAKYTAKLAVVTPADVGPFHFGAVVNKLFMRLNASDKFQLVSETDSVGLDQSIRGIPVLYREITLKLDGINKQGTPSTADDRPFLFLPTKCGVSLRFQGQITSAALPPAAGPSTYAPFADPSPPAANVTTGCATEQFTPDVTISNFGSNTATPTGMRVKVEVPQSEVGVTDATQQQSTINRVRILFPPGVEMNPAVASSLEACPTSEINADIANPDANTNRCQSNYPKSKIGDVLVDTPLLPDQVSGAMYLEQQGPTAATRMRFVLYLAMDGGMQIVRGGAYVAGSTNGPTAGLGSTSETTTDTSVIDGLPLQAGQLESDFNGLPDVAYRWMQLDFVGGKDPGDGHTVPMFLTPETCGYNDLKARLDATNTSAATTPATSPAYKLFQNTPPAHDPKISFQTTGGCGVPAFTPQAQISVTANSRTPDPTKATAHPDMAATITRADLQKDLKKTTFHLPAGLTGAPTATPKCPLASATAGSCPANTIVGEVRVELGSGPDVVVISNGRIYNTEPANADEPARLTTIATVQLGPFDLGKMSIPIETSLRAGDMGLDSTVILPQRFEGIKNHYRKLSMILYGYADQGTPDPADDKPFLTNPSKCQVNTFTLDAWASDGTQAPSPSANYTTTGCAIPFPASDQPTMDVKPTDALGSPVTSVTSETPTGLSIHVTNGSSSTFNPTIRQIQTVFPYGMTVNPAVGNDGNNAVCTTALIDAGGAGCPAASRRGEVHIQTPLLSGTFDGDVFLEEPGATKETRYRLALVVRLPGQKLIIRGSNLVDGASDLAGPTGSVNQGTGVITALFDNLVDLPFSSMDLKLYGGPRALLVSPATCGTQVIRGEVSPNSGLPPATPYTVNTQSSFEVTGCETTPQAPTFSATLTAPASRPADNPNLPAGHPDFNLTVTNPGKAPQIQNFDLELPPGFVADTVKTPRCSVANATIGACAADSIVGSVQTTMGSAAETLSLPGKLYNVVPQSPDEPAQLQVIMAVDVGPFHLGKLSIPVTTEMRSDYGITTHTTLPYRYEGIDVFVRSMTITVGGWSEMGTPGNTSDDVPFMINPTECGNHTINARITRRSGPPVAPIASTVNINPCPRAFTDLPPTPGGLGLKVTPSTTETAVPTGLAVEVTNSINNPTLKRIKVTMPDGMELNPAVANGLTVCPSAEIDNHGGAACVGTTADVGSVTLTTPLLPVAQTGRVFLEQPLGNDKDTRYRMAIVVHLPGKDLISRGKVTLNGSSTIPTGGTGTVDTGTGRMTTEFFGDNAGLDLPDLAFSKMTVNFSSGTRALLTNPRTCGVATFSADVTPHGGAAVQNISDSYTTTLNCGAEPFNPTFNGSAVPTTSAASPTLTMGFASPAKDAGIKQLDIALPTGLVAATGNVPLCGVVAASQGNCDSASDVGDVSAMIGDSNTLGDDYTITGDLFNVAPQANEPARLSARINVLVGPFDLGRLTIPITADLRSDWGVTTHATLPQRYEGIKVRMRAMSIALASQVGGKRFAINPSVCGTNTLTATMTSADASPQTKVGSWSYNTGGCAGFTTAPTIAVTPSTTQAGMPVGLRIDVNSDQNNPTIKRTEFTFPQGLEINPAFADGLNPCPTANVTAGTCSAATHTKIADITMTTHLMSSRPQGEMFLESPGLTKDDRYRVAIILHLPGRNLVVRGAISINGSTTIAPGTTGSTDETATGQLKADFDNIPDLGFTQMRLDFNAGSRAMLVNPVDCSHAYTFTGDFTPNSVATKSSATDAYTPTGCGASFAPTFTAQVSTTQAAGHPDLTLQVKNAANQQELRKLKVKLPVGLVANTTATGTRCSQADAANANCDPGEVVGDFSTVIGSTDAGVSDDRVHLAGGKIYNVVPNGNEPARMQAVMPVVVGPFDLGKLSIPVTTKLNPDMSVDADTTIPKRYEGVAVKIRQMDMVLHGTVGVNKFMINPSRCATQTISGVMESVDGLTRTNSSSFTTTGCAPVAAAYNPSVAFTNTPQTAGAPTALKVTMTLPGTDPAPTYGHSTTSNVKMTFPAGFELSPGAGNGLVACTTIDVDAGASCASTSARLASVSLTTPLLPAVQTGELYLEPSIGRQAATRFRLAMVVHLPGQNLIVRGGTLVDGSSDLPTGMGSKGTGDGHVTAEFPNLPDLGFTNLVMDFDGAKKLFVNPKTAGTFTVNAALTPHAGAAPVARTGTFSTSGGTSGMNGFAPTMTGSLTLPGPVPATSGSNPDLNLQIHNNDGMNELKELAINLPEGLVARTTGVPQCAEGDARAGNCAVASRVGSVTTTIGSFGDTLAVNGDIFNVVPSSDQPARMFAVVPVLVGPFDLGKLAIDVPTKLNDDLTVTATTVLPDRYEGISVRVRDLNMTILGVPSPGKRFMVAPSKCTGGTISADFKSNLGATSSSAFAFTVGGCPRSWVSEPVMAVSAAPAMRAAPANMTFDLTSNADNPTIKRMRVQLPDDTEINPAFGSVVDVCDLSLPAHKGGAGCPAASKIGVVKLRTQLLDPAKDYLGDVFLEPQQGMNAATRFRIAIVAHLPGADLVVRGKVTVAGATDVLGGTGSTSYAGPGQIVADFDQIPDLGFTSLSVVFNTNRPMLINPPKGGTQTLDVQVTPHSAPTATTLAPAPSYATSGGAAWSTFNPSFTAGVTATGAAAHPNFNISVGRSNNTSQPLRKLDIELPVGLVASTVATTRCTEANADAGNCLPANKVGSFTTRFGNGATAAEDLQLSGDIFNVEPRADEPARLSAMVDVVVGPFALGKLPIPITTKLRADAGIDTSTTLPVRYEGIAVRIKQIDITLLGMVGPKPFMQNPSKCGNNVVRARMTSWAPLPDLTETVVKQASFTTDGCPKAFTTAPTITAAVSPTETSVPTGFSLAVDSAADNPTIGKIAVDLPLGMSVNANAGKNLVTCSPDVNNMPSYGCAPGAQQGTVAVHTPLLGATYNGKVFIEDPIGNSKDTRFRMAIVLDLPGQSIVVRGRVVVDGSSTIPTGGTGAVGQGTGRITTVFDAVPDLSFDHFAIDLKTGPDALLTNPDSCGSHTVAATITPSSGGAAQAEPANSSFTLSSDGSGGACPPTQPFAPTFSVSAPDHTSGANTDLTLNVTSGNKDQQLTDFSVHLPAGLVADTDATAHCTQADAANAACTAGSVVGTVTTKIGTDSDINNTLELSGSIHNVEPNSNEPARLAAIMPVVVGPYDLGRLSIQVPTVLRPGDYGVDASAEIPMLYEGIRVRLRAMQMTMLGTVGANGFIKNPSKCDNVGSNAVSASLTGNGGGSATLYADYAVTGCPRGFVGGDPTIAVSGVNKEVEQPTGMTLDITSPDGNPSISRIKTTLPDGMTLNPAVGNKIEACAPTDVDNDNCLAKSIVGSAAMETPLLPGTHTGKVVLEQAGGTAATRYKLAVILNLPGTKVIVHGVTLVDGSTDLTGGKGSTAETGVTGRITADFPSLPDLNFSHMQIKFDNGADALLANSSQCLAQSVSAEFTPHSGGAVATSPSNSWNVSWDGLGGACAAPAARAFAPTFSGSVSTTLAAGNPDLTIRVARPDKSQQLKEFDLHLPPGLVADTSATNRCTIANADAANCAPDTVVGDVTTEIGTGTDLLAMSGKVHNVETDSGADNEPARLAAIFDVKVGPYDLGRLSIPVTTQIVTGAQPSDLAVDTHTVVPQRYEGIPVRMRSMEIKLRGKIGPKAFMINPSRCGAHTVNADMKSPDGAVANGSFSFTTVGCPAGFNPGIATAIPTDEGGVPTGFTFAVTSPAGSSSIRSVTTTLPEGFEINPGVANLGGPNSLQACDPTDVDNGDFSACPNARVGTVKLQTPLLPTTRNGAVWLETPGVTPATRYKLAIVVDLPGPDLVVHGQASVNGSGSGAGGGTGQVSATFDNLPDLQFSNLEVKFDAGDHAMLTSPKLCGSYQSSAQLAPWSIAVGQTPQEAAVTRTANVTVGSGCAADTSALGFAPTFHASLEPNAQTPDPNKQAASPDLNLKVTAGAKSARLQKMTIGLPVGLVANTTAATQCAQATAAAGACGPASKIGELTTEVGAGGDPLSVSGEIFNVAPNNNEPARMAASVNVLVGPYNLGKLVIPVSTKILPGNETDPQRRYGIDAVTDVPTRFEGVAIQMRSIDMTMYGHVGANRFIVNPSRCGTHTVSAALDGEGGKHATLTDDVAIGSCSNSFLGSTPTLAAQVNPTETAVPTDFTLTVNSAAANQTFESIKTTMPDGMTINPAFGNAFADTMTTCPTAVVDSGDLSSCDSAQIGSVTLTTPLLPGVQHGKVYLETPGAGAAQRYRLVIAVDVPGQTLIVRGRTEVDGSTDLIDGMGSTSETATGRMTAIFDNIPDLGFTSMTVAFDTGSRSLLTNPETCGAQPVSAEITPTSGAAPVGTAPATFTTSYNGAGQPCPAPASEAFAPSFSSTFSTTQAGGNPDLTMTITRGDKTQQLKQLDFELPAGLVADTVATPRCEQVDAAKAQCAETSRVGDVTTSVGTGSETLTVGGGIYNVKTSNDDEPARLAAILGVQVGPYNLGKLSVPVTTEIIGNTAESLRILTHTTVPTRYEGIPVRLREMKIKLFGEVNGNAFMINPSKCATHTISAQMTSTLGASHTATSNFTTDNCASAPYSPSLSAALKPDGRTGKPVGLELGFDLPGASSSTKKITTVLPAGMNINPGVGNLAGPAGTDPMTCAPADVAAGGAACPAASRIGTVELETPLLPPPARTGTVFLEDKISDNAADRYRVGVYVSLPGASLAVHGVVTVDGSSDLTNGLGSVDQGTGQITAVFDNLPDLQFSHLRIKFNTTDVPSSKHALLLNPETCGNHVVRALMVPWSRPLAAPNQADANVSVTGCDTPAGPLGMTASLSSYGVGQHADFTLGLSRPDGNRSILSTKFELPKGLVGSADATPTCPDDMSNAQIGVCDPQTKIGEVAIGVGSSEDTFTMKGDVFNVAAPADRPAKLAFSAAVKVGPYNLGRVVVPVDVNIDPNEYFLWAQTGNMPQRFEGVPVRISSLSMKMFGLAPNTLDHKPFMSNPRSCPALQVKARVSFVSGAPVDLTDSVGPFTGCAGLNLNDNTVDVVNHNDSPPLDRTPEAPTALRVTVHQGNQTTQAGLKDMTLKTPGFRLNAPVAGDADVCTNTQLDSQTCPAASRVGRTWLDTPLLPKNVSDPLGDYPGQHSLWGSIYLLTPGSSGTDRYRLAIQMTGKTLITIRGTAVVDETKGSPTEGDMVTVFKDLPDIPFDDMRVELNGVDTGSGAKPLLLNPANPSTSGPATVNGVGAAMVAWSDDTQASGYQPTWTASQTPVTVKAGTTKGFAPTMADTFSTKVSGTHPDVSFTYTRPDGNLDINKVKMSLPAGFLGSAAAVPKCPVATAAAGNCSSTSEVGTVTVSVGQFGGTLTLPGTVYMTEGVSGDIAGMSIKVRAEAGKYDLGNFITQGRIKLRPTDHGIDVDFDDVPNMFKGVPTHIQSMRIDMPGVIASTGKPLLFNASNCSAMQLVSLITPYGGTPATVSDGYQATGCETRTFSPSISFQANNVVDDRIAPSWTIKMGMNNGDSTLKSTTVVLPSVMTVNVAGLGDACPADVASQGHGACPASSQMGTVTVNTPLLPTPVTGTVYMAKSVSGSGLPDMLLDIPEPIDMQIRGANRFINSADSASRIQSTFSNLPDLIWSDMTMTITGGPKGILGLRTNGVCGAATSAFDSHSGQHVDTSSPVTGLEGYCQGLDKVCATPAVGISTKGVKKKGNKKMSTKLTLSTASHCKTMKSVRITYPKGTKIDKKLVKKSPKNLTGKLGSRSLKSKDFKILGSNALTFAPVFPTGTRSIAVNSANSALVLPFKTFCGGLKGAKLKSCQKKNVTFTFEITNTDGTAYRYNYTVPAGSKFFK
jgi:hypothetical protein